MTNVLTTNEDVEDYMAYAIDFFKPRSRAEFSFYFPAVYRKRILQLANAWGYEVLDDSIMDGFSNIRVIECRLKG